MFSPYRTLGTPNEEVWPGVTSLQDFKPNFPQWKGNNLATAVKNIDSQGLDLLEVRSFSDVVFESCKASTKIFENIKISDINLFGQLDNRSLCARSQYWATKVGHEGQKLKQECVA